MSRKRVVSEVDPLDESSFSLPIASSIDTHDFAGTSNVPDLHIIRTRSRRASSIIKPINTLLGRVEVDDDDPAQGSKHAIEEANEDEEDDDGAEHGVTNGLNKTDTLPDNSQPKLDPNFKRVDTLPNIQDSNSSNDGESGSITKGDSAGTGNNLEKVKTTRSAKHRRNRKEAHKVALMFLKVFIIILTAFIGILSIYWGSLYDRPKYMKNIPYLVIVEEQEVGPVPPLIGRTLVGVLNSTSARAVGNFDFKTISDFTDIASSHNNSIKEEVYRQVHHQEYWGAFYVRPNATLDYLTALSSANTSYNASSIDFIYETGMNPQGVSSFVTPVIYRLEDAFISAASNFVTSNLVNSLSNDQKLELATNGSSLLGYLKFNYIDYRPMAKGVIMGPIQLGLIYLVVLSFHQFNFASATHELIRTKLRLRQYLVYHIITSQGAYFIMSLVYCLLILAFQVSITPTFGHSGFLVAWVTVYLTMSALGGITENCALQIFARNRAYIGFWITFFLTVNIASVFSPIILMNRFYRYSYATPLYNCHELLKIVLMDTYKGYMGRYYGVLIAWIALANILLPFTLKSTKEYQKRVEARAKEALK